MLSSERLTFVQLKAQHKNIFTPILMDKQMMRYITGYPLPFLEASERFEKHIAFNNEHQNVGYFLIFNTDILIGYTKFTPYEKDKIEIGYAILPAFRKQGYAKESIQAMLSFAKELAFSQVIGLCDPMNIDSISLLKYFGFTSKPDTFNPETVVLTLNLEK